MPARKKTIEKMTVGEKPQTRSLVVDEIMRVLNNDVIYWTTDKKKRERESISHYMQQLFLAKLESIHELLAPGESATTHKRRASRSLLWQDDVPKVTNSFTFLGVRHQPDFVVDIDDQRIAVGVKRGETGAALQEALGESIVYSKAFDVVCYVFVDCSQDQKVKGSLNEKAEYYFVESLWENHRIRFNVV